MNDVKLAVIYYSTYGTNHEMAQVARGAGRDAGAEVRLLKVPETAPEEVVAGQEAWVAQRDATADVPVVSDDDMVWADAYLFSAPTRYGGAASQMRAFIDTLGPLWSEGKLVDKHVSAMTSAQNAHGGQETTLQSLYVTFMHWGTIIVTPGYGDPAFFAAGGNPYGTSVSADGTSLSDEAREAIAYQTRRLLTVTGRHKMGQRELAAAD